MHPILNVAIQAIRKSGNFVIKQYGYFNINNATSSDSINKFITKIRAQSNRITIETIRKFYPLHIISTNHEYYVNHKDCHKNVCWIIASIDSDINYINQFPFFTLSIAVLYKTNIEIGVIYDPIHNELFSACRGKGAHLNDHRIRIHDTRSIMTKKLRGFIFAISFIPAHQQITSNILHKLCNHHIIDFRRTGATILDLAYVAVGRIDGCFIISLENNKNNQLELASGIIILRESGGLITDFYGNGADNNTFSGNLIAGSPRVIKTILPVIK